MALSSPLNFTYVTNVLVQRVWPLRGPSSGGTMVWVKGVDFNDETTHCRIAGVTVTATVLNSGLLKCVTPPHGYPGYVSIELTDNANFDFTSTGLMFVYEEAVVFDVHPSSGPIYGGTHVRISGQHLEPFVLACRIDGSIVGARAHEVSTQREVVTTSHGVAHPIGIMEFITPYSCCVRCRHTLTVWLRSSL